MLQLYRALTRLRRAEPALSVGDYATVAVGAAGEDVLAYRRTHGEGDAFLVVLNFGGAAHTLDLSAEGARATVALATDMQRDGDVKLAALDVGPDEGLVLRVRGGFRLGCDLVRMGRSC